MELLKTICDYITANCAVNRLTLIMNSLSPGSIS